MMDVRALNSRLQDKAIKELNEDPKRVHEDLEHFRNWLQKQQHLTVRLDNQFLISFLRGCKWSLQHAKEKIDNYYTIRNFIPELFTDKDPFLPEIQNVLEAGILYPLSCTDSAGPILLYLNVSNAHSKGLSFEDVTKVLFITMEILLKESDNFTVAGFILIGNYEKVPLNYFLQFTPGLMKKCVTCLTRAYPVRVKTYVAINAPFVLDTILNTMIKPFLSEKLKQRLHVFSSKDSVKLLYDIVDKSLLPQELGGHHGSIHEATELWKKKVESYRDWILEDAKYGSNEKLRVGLPKTYDDSFGMDGTFRKLNID